MGGQPSLPLLCIHAQRAEAVIRPLALLQKENELLDPLAVAALITCLGLAMNVGGNNSAAEMGPAFGAGVRSKQEAIALIAIGGGQLGDTALQLGHQGEEVFRDHHGLRYRPSVWNPQAYPISNYLPGISTHRWG